MQIIRLQNLGNYIETNNIQSNFEELLKYLYESFVWYLKCFVCLLQEKSGEPYSGKLSVKSDLSPVFGKFLMIYLTSVGLQVYVHM